MYINERKEQIEIKYNTQFWIIIQFIKRIPFNKANSFMENTRTV